MSRNAVEQAASDLGPPEVAKIDYDLKVLVVGGGIGGLTLAKTLENAGAKVKVVERAGMETILQAGAGGPIQLASNALGILKKVDPQLYRKIENECTITGLRTNGLKDGQTGGWYLKFDTKTPANERNLPPTSVIDRPVLQGLLINDLNGEVETGRALSSYENLPEGGVKVKYDDGSSETADLVVGADGIWSQVRAQMHNQDKRTASYSGFKVYAGIANYVPKDIDDVGYSVFMGRKKYFVSTDIGGGRLQWYAFIGQDSDAPLRKEQEALSWLKDDVFGKWTPQVREMLSATDPDVIESRPLYDRPPQLMRRWSDGCVALVGDALHPMMPNLGQGGCMAIEDAYVMADELAKVSDKSQVPEALKNYRMRRQVRTAAVQGLSRFGAEMLLNFFDHPMRVETIDGFPRFVNFGYNSFCMAMWKILGVLDVSFKLQFAYLFGKP
eukprot:CAMPEP_0197524920 /NCGR_PEP_ID=MMETSP1318-20131121/10348_1 /TAXON_ID=552666 /ORGANISM="Partenskyella glossopodia, Strain RCC365" /LENGTH=441 /DNA_ID=CAMNT_0043078021 /DNA_START=323 /DNA_END=1648 /DNA_ORIENTATION=+